MPITVLFVFQGTIWIQVEPIMSVRDAKKSLLDAMFVPMTQPVFNVNLTTIWM